ncbi:probable serine/threonine-protein kinase DDB_G0280111 isoform X2 [Neltuma alba]|uniref:probable serine/threonine-protein kinase DDB_G0280111 isoform X2 n=1 Tax=Neltuma alba TaxID=207710 RepID=UPI0010A57F23|nr:probable serine/threonine-protein kinase DDB_G0280111 isoform X2 [Prosopis alba]
MVLDVGTDRRRLVDVQSSVRCFLLLLAEFWVQDSLGKIVQVEMWRFRPFTHKEPAGLEGRTIDVGNLKINVQKAVAEGGFSCVYLARDAVHMSKRFALKHIICNDEESLGLVKKEISVMKSLKGHPNVVTLYAQAIFDMGRTKEAFLVMEFCEKSLVQVLESRGTGYFEEQQVLLIFRDICNAVFAMHCQSPPIAHRDLKAENLLLASDGLWKLCDFGSVSTNHKRFEKPEEMGIEEDNIRKYTTPAYRAPEMWDLFLKEAINEKVDLWALGCLLFRICYFRSAFDGESKLQVLNGNYRIPDSPKYSSSIVDLIRDMLQARPDDRPDITQVWFRVNEQLPVNLQRSLPDTPPEFSSSNKQEGASKPANRSTPVPRRSPPPASGEPKTSSQSSISSMGGGGGGQLGAFWSTQHAQKSLATEGKGKPIEEPACHSISSKLDRLRPANNQLPNNVSPSKVGQDHSSEKRMSSNVENTTTFQGQAFNAFVADFDTSKFNSGPSYKSDREAALEAEVEKLKGQLKEVNLEKAEITSKYEKLTGICRSQRQDLQDLKLALAAKTPSPKKEAHRIASTVATSTAMKCGTVREQGQNKAEWKTPGSEPKSSWQAFPEEPLPRRPVSVDNTSKSVGRGGQQNNQPAQPATQFNSWAFGTENFSAIHTGSPQMPRHTTDGSNSEAKSTYERESASQPAGWAGF